MRVYLSVHACMYSPADIIHPREKMRANDDHMHRVELIISWYVNVDEADLFPWHNRDRSIGTIASMLASIGIFITITLVYLWMVRANPHCRRLWNISERFLCISRNFLLVFYSSSIMLVRLESSRSTLSRDVWNDESSNISKWY